MTARRPPCPSSETACSRAVSNADNSSFTAMRIAWNVRVAGCIRLPRRGLTFSINSANSSEVLIGRFCTINLAIRLAARSSPRWKIRSASSDSAYQLTMSAAVTCWSKLNRMSSGSDRRKLKPRDSRSS